MREIIFKAKRLDNGEWVEGLLTVMWGQYHIINPKDENTAYPIDTDTICQYTGLTDKNGNKIWENDIVCTPYIDPIFGGLIGVEIDYDYHWKVAFYEGMFCVENETDRFHLRDFVIGGNIEVISSAVDNHELLKNE